MTETGGGGRTHDSGHALQEEYGSSRLQIKGVGLLLAAHIVCVTRGFTQHLDAKELEAYIGIAPYEYESGTSVYRRPRSDGQGPAALRKVLHLAAQSLAYHHADFRAYYQRKALEGKPHNLILNNISSKLLKIIVAVIKRGKYFERYQSLNPDILKSREIHINEKNKS